MTSGRTGAPELLLGTIGGSGTTRAIRAIRAHRITRTAGRTGRTGPEPTWASRQEEQPWRCPIRMAALDMAGTTVADDGAVEEAFQVALDSVGLTAESLVDDPAAYVRRTMGRSKIEVFAGLLGGDRHIAERANLAFEAAFDRAVDRGEVVPKPGVDAVFSSLRASGIRICLTTGFSPATRDQVITALGWTGAVDLALSPVDAGRGRPWPDMILAAILRLRIDDVREVAVAGDTASDLEAGTRAGASVVAGVLGGAHSRTELEDAPHTHLIRSIEEFPALVVA